MTYDEPLNIGVLSGVLPEIERGSMHRLTPMVSLAYSGLTDHTLGIEFQRPVLLSTLTDALYPVEMAVLSGRVVGTYLRERLRLVVVVTSFGLDKNYGQLVRAESAYEVQDGLKISLAYVHFRPPSSGELGPLSGMNEHDQLLMVGRWDFQR